MATKNRTHAGTVDCLCCGHEIPAKQSDNGTLNLSCQWCDFTAYAKVGTEAHKLAMAKLKNKPTDDRTVVDLVADIRKTGATTASAVHDDLKKQKVAPVAPPPTPPRKRNSIFDI